MRYNYMNHLKYILTLIFLSTICLSQIEYTYTGVTYFQAHNKIGDIKMDVTGVELSWNYLAGRGISGGLGLGGTDLVIQPRFDDPNYTYTDLKSNGRFAANFYITKNLGIFYLSTGIKYYGIAGDMETKIDPDQSVSEFDKFVQENNYRFYEFPIALGVHVDYWLIGLSVGIHRSTYFSHHEYTEYIYQGLSNVEVDSRSYTFNEKDENSYIDLLFSINITEATQFKIQYAFPYIEGDLKSGMEDADRNEVRIFFGQIFN